MKKYAVKWQAFSLVELLVTIGIIGMLTVLMIPAMRSFDKRNKLNVSADQIKSALTEVRNYATSPRIEDVNKPRVYALRFKDLAEERTYEIGYWDIDTLLLDETPDSCSASSTECYDKHWFSISKRSLPSGVKVSGTENSDVCPNLIINDQNGPGKNTDLSIGFKVPNGRPIFDLFYDENNRNNPSAGQPCSSSDVGWTSAAAMDTVPANSSFIKICDNSSPAQCKTVYVNSYTSQFVVK